MTNGFKIGDMVYSSYDHFYGKLVGYVRGNTNIALVCMDTRNGESKTVRCLSEDLELANLPKAWWQK